jgi:hypothetical protein
MAKTQEETAKATEQAGRSIPKVEWDDSKMKTTYANVANAASTREEVTVLFGTNQTWNLAKDKEVVVELTDRIILSPYAAKRLWLLLGGVLKEYESRFGKLDVGLAPEVTPQPAASGSTTTSAKTDTTKT